MKYTLEIDAENTVRTITTRGIGTQKRIEALLEELFSHLQWKPGMSLLFDHRELQFKNNHQSVMITFSDFLIRAGSNLGNGKLAVVMDAEFDWNILKAWELITASQIQMEIGIFRSIDNAKAWVLGPPKDPG